jgi:CubicO group peptidase (beta-lactamase class C family)
MEENNMNIVKPETQGFSSKRLDRINTVIQRYVAEKKIAGVVSLIARHGEIVHFEKAGMADIESGKAMQLDSIFRIYSMSKPITSTAVMMLFEEGKFLLTDPISRFIPAFKEVKVLDNTSGSGGRYIKPAREVSIHDLLTHTAGLSYGFDDDVYIDELYRKKLWAFVEKTPDLTLQACIERVAKLPLASQPGTMFRYSFATDVLGYLVQVVSGMPFEDFLTKRIFEPLGMEDTDFYVPTEKVQRFTSVYGPNEKSGLIVSDAFNASRYLRPTRNPSGGGGLVSTTSDYFRFCQMLLNKGELNSIRLLGRKTVEWMTINHLPNGVFPFEDQSSGFGLGFGVLLDIGKSTWLGSVGNYGWGGAANTNFWIDPQEELIGILMLQYMPSDTYPIVPDFRNLTYQALID